MDDDDVLRMTEREFENRCTLSYQLGLVARVESLPAHFRACAGRAYADGFDNKALWYRELADRFDDDAKAARKQYDASRGELEAEWGEVGSTMPAPGGEGRT
jgi:hypothetical protein